MRKIITLTILVVTIFTARFLYAQKQADITFDTNQTSAAVGEEFLLDVFVNPQPTAINGVALSILLPSNISFVRYQDAGSLDGLWVDAPIVNNNTVSFSRIFLSNFTGTIDPFNYKAQTHAKVVRLVVKGKQVGTGFAQIKKAVANKADGTGSEFVLTSEQKIITITNTINEKEIILDDKNKPTLSAKLVLVSKDSSDTLLVAHAQDNESGIQHLQFKFDNKKWNNFTSPLLINETCFDAVTVKATDWSRNEAVSDKLVNQHKKCNPKNWPVIGFILLLIVAMVVYIIEKEKEKRKTRHFDKTHSF